LLLRLRAVTAPNRANVAATNGAKNTARLVARQAAADLIGDFRPGQ